MIARCINNMLRSLKLNAKFKELMDDSDKRFGAIYHGDAYLLFFVCTQEVLTKNIIVIDVF